MRDLRRGISSSCFPLANICVHTATPPAFGKPVVARKVLNDGCQGWTRTNTERFNKPPCYFDTTWNGAAGRRSTCIVPFRRRMPHVFGHDSNRTRNSEFGAQGKLNCTGIAVHSAFRVPHSAFEKLVSAAGLAPALPRFQAEHVAATPRAENSGRLIWKRRSGETQRRKPWPSASR